MCIKIIVVGFVIAAVAAALHLLLVPFPVAVFVVFLDNKKASVHKF